MLIGAFALAACGDPSAVAEVFADGIGPQVLLQRESTECPTSTSGPLLSQLGPGVEFPVERTKALSTPCDGGLSPGIEIDVAPHGVVFDFSSVRAPGAFSRSEFDGYVLRFARGCGEAALASASLDAQSSDGLENVILSTHLDRLKVNLAGVRYDQSSFLKIDLSWVAIRCLRDPVGVQG